MGHVIVTVSRQLASGGAYVGQEVARILGVKYVDREILAEAATILKEDPAILEQREERVSTFLESFLRTMCVGAPDAGYFPPPFPVIYDEQIFSCEARIIRKMALEQSCVIVGRAANHFLKGYAGVLNVFLHAPREVRLRRLMEIYHCSELSKAEEMLRQSDHARKRFNERLTGGHWPDAHHYDLCIDTEVAGFPLTIETIVALARRTQERVR